MTLTAISSSPERMSSRIISVACYPAASNPDQLAAALRRDSDPRTADWQVVNAETISADTHVDLAVGDAAVLPELIRRWPDAIAVVIVSQGGDATVLAALRAGATCIRSSDPDLTAAYVLAVTRRAGLLGGESPGGTA